MYIHALNHTSYTHVLLPTRTLIQQKCTFMSTFIECRHLAPRTPHMLIPVHTQTYLCYESI